MSELLTLAFWRGLLYEWCSIWVFVATGRFRLNPWWGR